MIFKQLLKKMFGGQVSMQYIDIQDSERMEKYPEAKKVLEAKSMSSLPLVAFDSTPLWLGSLSYPYIIDELGKRGIKPVA